MSNTPHIVCFGGGIDSTAMVLGLYEKNLPIDLILFADTGGERPETYQHIENFNNWLIKNNLQEIKIVKRVTANGEKETLEEECLRTKNLPSIAYGFKTCSQKHKIAPQDKFMNSWQPAIDTWKSKNKCVKYIGYDINEQHRADNNNLRNDVKYDFLYPLIDWHWDREQCKTIIKKHGFINVSKSSCFYCPSSRPKEIIDLYEKHPNLIQRALDMEQNAELTHIKGLGRNYAWSEIIVMHKSQMTLPFTGFDLPCECTE
jgi:hypothetical protein